MDWCRAKHSLQTFFTFNQIKSKLKSVFLTMYAKTVWQGSSPWSQFPGSNMAPALSWEPYALQQQPGSAELQDSIWLYYQPLMWYPIHWLPIILWCMLNCGPSEAGKCRSCIPWCRASPGRRWRCPPSPGPSPPPSPRELRCLIVSALALDLNFLSLKEWMIVQIGC